MKRPQAVLAIGSLVTGAAVCSLLLNLYGGTARAMTASFSALGANIIVAPRDAASSPSSLPSLMPMPARRLAALRERIPGFIAAPMLYAVVHLDPGEPSLRFPAGIDVLAVGTSLPGILKLNPEWRLTKTTSGFSAHDCLVGAHIGRTLGLRTGSALELRVARDAGRNSQSFTVAGTLSTGGSEDDQVFLDLAALQRLTGAGANITTAEIRVPGDTQAIKSSLRELQAALPEFSVRPVRQIVYSEGKVLGTVRRLTTALTGLILAIVILCVGATMTAIVLERRKDVAVMKALGASDRAVMEIFLSEGAVLGLLGGVAGFLLGALVARWVGLRLFGVALAPAAWVFPVVVAATVLLGIAATLLPVRVVRSIEPAAALKGQ